MPKRDTDRKYATMLDQWRRELSAEIGEDVTYRDIEAETGLSYSTLMKHTSHKFVRPDYGTAQVLCDYFNSRSARARTPLEYFVAVEPPADDESEGQPVAVAVH